MAARGGGFSIRRNKMGIAIMPKKLLIMGAAGRDFHVFNCLYRDNEDV